MSERVNSRAVERATEALHEAEAASLYEIGVTFRHLLVCFTCFAYLVQTAILLQG